MYRIDQYFLLCKASKPPVYSYKIEKAVTKSLPPIFFAHICIAIWFYGSKYIYWE